MDATTYVTRAELLDRLAEIQTRTTVTVELPWWVNLACFALIACFAALLACIAYSVATRIGDGRR